MKIDTLAGRALIAVALIACGPAQAHHSNTAYDTGTSVEWQAAVTEFRFVNPHAYVYFTMQDGSGSLVQGRCELGARTTLARLGWTAETLRPGEKITLQGAPGRNEANVCLLHAFTRGNGAVVGARQPVDRQSGR